jgi:hypothetical protein
MNSNQRNMWKASNVHASRLALPTPVQKRDVEIQNERKATKRIPRLSSNATRASNYPASHFSIHRIIVPLAYVPRHPTHHTLVYRSQLDDPRRCDQIPSDGGSHSRYPAHPHSRMPHSSLHPTPDAHLVTPRELNSTYSQNRYTPRLIYIHSVA